jgi:hypothetical protein
MLQQIVRLGPARSPGGARAPAHGDVEREIRELGAELGRERVARRLERVRGLRVSEAMAEEGVDDGPQPLERLRTQGLEEGQARGNGAARLAGQRAERGHDLLHLECAGGDVQEERMRQLLTTRGHVRGTLRRARCHVKLHGVNIRPG